MEVGGNGTITASANLATLAARAEQLAANNDARVDVSRPRQSSESRPRPTINTNTHHCLDHSFHQRTKGTDTWRDNINRHSSGHDLQNNTNGRVTNSHRPPSSGRSDATHSARLSPQQDGDSLATSPALRQYTIPTSEGSPMETLPAMQMSPARASKSPNAQQSLPSLASQLGSFKDAPPPIQNPTHVSRQSFSSNDTLHSPPKELAAIHPPSYTNVHARPYPGAYGNTEPSPASTNSAVSPRDFRPGQSVRSMSPPPKFGPRQYQSTGLTPQSEVQTPLSATSTQTSVQTLSTESSPNVDGLDLDRPILPPLDGAMINGGFRCDYPGCNAQSFQTQYLLNSHANVHSQNRPHYCPVKTCSRSEGGKGFKRKNEMIRHGLVHQSPGYICPFCPEREHKYPRPDNLQRHVRVHHVDKDKDDPQLREVLAQRPEGGSRGRRRRVNS